MDIFTIDILKFAYEILLPCILACVFGGIVGLQRERADRPAGLRTHTLVCLGATVFTLVSRMGFSSLSGVDPSRVAAAVVTGIGFIGAGAIFRLGTVVKGITTAASIWIVAAIGLALGTSLYYLALTTTIISFITLSLVKYFEDRFIRISNYLLTITASEKFSDFSGVINFLKKISTEVGYQKYSVDEEKGKIVLTIAVQSKDPKFTTRVLQNLKEVKHIEKITIS